MLAALASQQQQLLKRCFKMLLKLFKITEELQT
jgi:hypothetical protein